MSRLIGILAAIVMIALIVGLSFLVFSPPPAAPTDTDTPQDRAPNTAGRDRAPANATRTPQEGEQSAPPVETRANEAPPPRPSFVHGIVLDEGGTPIRDATIIAVVRGQSDVRGRSADDGTFRLAVNAKGDGWVTVHATHPNWTRARADVQCGRYTVFRLYKGHVVSFRVIDETEKPIANARVLSFRRDDADSYRFQEPVDPDSAADGTTDALGNARLRMQEGVYDAVVLLRGTCVAIKRGVAVFEDETRATIVTQPTITIAGRVVSPDNEPIAGAQVRALSLWYEQTVKTDETGAFRFTGVGVSDDDVADLQGASLSVRHPAHASFHGHVGGPDTVSTEALTIRLDPKRPLAVRVQYSDGSPARNHSVRENRTDQRQTTNEDGYVSFPSCVHEGPFLVVYEQGYEKPSRTKRVGTPEATGIREIVLEVDRWSWNAAATVEVVTSKGLPVQGGTVHVTFEGRRNRRTAITDADGRARFEGLPRRTFMMGVVHPDYPPSSWRLIKPGNDAPPLHRFVIGDGIIAGRVVDLTGKGIQATVSLSNRYTMPGSKAILTDRAGHFRIENVSDGYYGLQVDESSQGLRQLTWPDVKAGDLNVEVLVATPRSGTDGCLRLNVIDAATGQPPTPGGGNAYLSEDAFEPKHSVAAGGLPRFTRIGRATFRYGEQLEVDTTYHVVVDVPGYQRAVVSHHVNRSPASWRLTVPLHRGLTLSGRLIDASGTPLTFHHGAKTRVRALRLNESDFDDGFFIYADVESDGTFALTGLSAGKTTLSVIGPFIRPTEESVEIDLKQSLQNYRLRAQYAGAVRLLMPTPSSARRVRFEFVNVDRQEGGPEDTVDAKRLSPARGGYLVPGLTPGRYTCELTVGNATRTRRVTVVAGVEKQLAFP